MKRSRTRSWVCARIPPRRESFSDAWRWREKRWRKPRSWQEWPGRTSCIGFRRPCSAQALIGQNKPAEALAIVEKTASEIEARGYEPVVMLDFARGDALARMNRLDEAVNAFQRESAIFRAAGRRTPTSP